MTDGYQFVLDRFISNALQVSEDDSVGGSDTALVLCDMSQFLVGIDGAMRIETSEHFKFGRDQTTFRALMRMGWQLLRADACIVQEITGAS